MANLRVSGNKSVAFLGYSPNMRERTVVRSAVVAQNRSSLSCLHARATRARAMARFAPGRLFTLREVGKTCKIKYKIKVHSP